jgi:hypothetical protein
MKTRKTMTLILILLLLGGTSAFAAQGGLAIGIEGALNFGGVGGMPAGALIVFRLPQLPVMWGIGFDSAYNIGATGDYWFWHYNLGSVFALYAGIGGYMRLGLGSSPVTFAGGARIPVALQAWPFGKNLELFLEAAPAIGISIIPTAFDGVRMQAAIGLRYWF